MGALKRRDEGLAVSGLSELQRALKRVESEVGKDLKAGLRAIGKGVASDAARNVQNKTGRHGKGPRLGPSINTSVSAVGASIYSNAPHSIVQDVGGRVGRGRATLLARASVSKYMTRAVADSKDEVEREIGKVLDKVERDFER